jgi:L-2,4-diaminobutyrate decarboxylase
VFLVRDAKTLGLLRRRIPYLDPNDGGPQAGPNLVAKSLETTRRFDALKVLVTLRAVGQRQLATLLDHAVTTARKAAEVIDNSADLQLLAPPMTNTVMLRWAGVGKRASAALINAVNRELPYRLWRGGGPVVGTAVYQNLKAIKLTFTSPLHDGPQVERMLARVSAVANALCSELEHEGAFL